MNLLVYSLCLFGLAYVAGHSRISAPIRQILGDRGEVCTRCALCGVYVPQRRWQWISREDGKGKRMHCPECNRDWPDEGGSVMRVRYGFKPLLWLVEFLECPACLGFHIGFWGSVIAPHQLEFVVPQFALLPPLLAAVASGCLSAGINTCLGFACGLMQRVPR